MNLISNYGRQALPYVLTALAASSAVFLKKSVREATYNCMAECAKTISESPSAQKYLKVLGQAAAVSTAFAAVKKLTSLAVNWKDGSNPEANEKFAKRVAVFLTILTAAGLSFVANKDKGYTRMGLNTLLLSAPVAMTIASEIKDMKISFLNGIGSSALTHI